MVPPPVLPVICPPAFGPHRKVSSIVYQPLPTSTSIRLIKIHPLKRLRYESDLYAPLHFSIVTVDLDDNPEFDALSYVWGNPRAPSEDDPCPPETWLAPTFEVYHDGRPVSVTANLYAALLALRALAFAREHRSYRVLAPTIAAAREDEGLLPAFSAKVWIDQVCINQQDVPERNGQVQLMGAIYRRARSVPVWIGGHDGSVDAFHDVQTMLWGVDYNQGGRYCNVRIFNSDSLELAGLPRISVGQWLGLFRFLKRSWFTRAWIVQEAVFAKKLEFVVGLNVFSEVALAGFHIFLETTGWLVQLADAYASRGAVAGIPWPQLAYNNIQLFQEIYELKHRTIGNREPAFMVVQSRIHGPAPLSELVRRCRASQATDPRDKVYAWIGLSKESVQGETIDLIVPDYSLPAQQVYIRTARFLVLSSRDLGCFSLKEDEKTTKLRHLPSWVPDFSVLHIHVSLHDVSLRAAWAASAALEGGLHVRYSSDDGETMEVRGVRVGSIRATHAFKDAALSPSPEERLVMRSVLHRGLAELLECVPEMSCVALPPRRGRAGATSPCDTASQSRLEVLWRTLLHDRLDRENPAPAHCADHVLADLRLELACLVMCTVKGFSALTGKAEETRPPGSETLRLEVGEGYTEWKKLLGLYPAHAEGLVYPPGYEAVMRWIEDCYVGGGKTASSDGLEMEQATRFLNIVLARMRGLDNGTVERANQRRGALVCSKGRALFALDTGLLGSGLWSVQKGDEAWVLCGGSVPVVLRPVGGGRYRLVGDAYVHGIMYGNSRYVASENATNIVLV